MNQVGIRAISNGFLVISMQSGPAPAGKQTETFCPNLAAVYALLQTLFPIQPS